MCNMFIIAEGLLNQNRYLSNIYETWLCAKIEASQFHDLAYNFVVFTLIIP